MKNMSFIKKWKIEIGLFIFLALGFVFSRLYNLLLIPIFTDEAIYLHWAQIAKNDAAWRFISLTDGKQPLFVWLTMVVMRFVTDPLLAGRLVSVGAGLASLIGLFFLTRELFKNIRVGIVASAFYLVFPFAFVYDRMALMDGLVGTFAVWSLYFEILLVRRLRLDIALILGMILGGGVLTKSTGFISLYLLPASLLLFNWNDKKRWQNFLKWIGLAMISVVEVYTIYSVLRLSPFFHIIGQKNAVFIYPLSEWFTHPFRFLWGNLRGVWDWFVTYTTWPVIGLMAASLLIYRQYTKEKVLLLFWFIVPFVSLALFGRVLYPRFIFFMTLSLLPLAALSLIKLADWIKNSFILYLLYFILLFLVFRFDFLILTDPLSAPLPFSDKEQYLNGWFAGGGVKETVAFFEEKREKIYVATEGTFGLMPYALEIYLRNNPNIEIQGFWPLDKQIPEEVYKKSQERETYFVFNQSQTIPAGWPLKFIAKYPKGRGEYFLSIYQVKP